MEETIRHPFCARQWPVRFILPESFKVGITCSLQKGRLKLTRLYGMANNGFNFPSVPIVLSTWPKTEEHTDMSFLRASQISDGKINDYRCVDYLSSCLYTVFYFIISKYV